MHTSIRKRVFSILAAVAMIVAFGCGKAALDEQTYSDPLPEIVALESESSGEENGNTASAASGDSSGESYSSTAPGENAVLVQNGGTRTITDAPIDKTGDEAGDLPSGGNAAVAALSQGQLTLNACNVSTRASGAPGLFVSGAGSVFCTDGTIFTEGVNSPCVLFSGGSVSLKQVSLTASNGVSVRVVSGENELTLENMTLSDNPLIAEGAFLTLRLLGGASFTGTLGDTLPARASVFLDETSGFTLTGDTYLSVFANADATHQNVQSNGFSLYYDSNAPDNAYLNAQSYMLPGGGFLSPII